MKVPIEVSARHVHLNKNDLEILFGQNYELTLHKDISQPGQYSAKETVDLKNGDRIIKDVRIVGPLRNESQVEISKTDSYFLKIDVPIKISGDINDSSGLILIGPKDSLKLVSGVIIAKRHLHISPEEAQKINLKDGQKLSMKIPGERSLVFNEIIVRSRNGKDKLAFHLDTDEANAANVKQGDTGEIL